MTKDEAIARLQELQRDGDKEIDHKLADDVLCEVLIANGMGDVVSEWEKVEKWYA